MSLDARDRGHSRMTLPLSMVHVGGHGVGVAAPPVSWDRRRKRPARAYLGVHCKRHHAKPHSPEHSNSRAIDYFFTENQSHRIDYSCIVIERKALDHAKYNDGDGEIFFQKIMYQLAISLTRKYNDPKSIRKRMLAEYINTECCVDFLGKPTGSYNPHFNIWKLRLRERGSRA